MIQGTVSSNLDTINIWLH